MPRGRLTRLTAHQAAARLASGDVSSVELTEAYLERIAAVDGAIRAYITVTADVARRQARAADRRRAAGEAGPLLGVPYGLKDNWTTAGITTTAGSQILANYVPPDSATVHDRLQAAGGVLLGKLNLDEFGMGSSTERSAFFATRNPWDLARVPGGSSGGAAAAVAADLCAFAVASDTGGSIRQPAALCGTVGLKPTYGRVSRYGLVAFASSLDQGGPVTKDVRDAALVLGAIAGRDENDATTLDEPVPDLAARLEGGVSGLRLGIPAEYFGDGLAPDVRETVTEAVGVLESLGATPVPVSLPHVAYAVAAYYVVATAEASANLARYDGVRYGYAVDADDIRDRVRQSRGEAFGPEVKRRIMLGTYALSRGYYEAYYGKASRARALIGAGFDAALSECDLLVGPTSPTTAFRLGEKTDDPLAMYLSDSYTIALNLAGHPGLSLPCGFVDGLPVGLQIMGRHLDESTVLQVARAYESATGWRDIHPQLEEAAA